MESFPKIGKSGIRCCVRCTASGTRGWISRRPGSGSLPPKGYPCDIWSRIMCWVILRKMGYIEGRVNRPHPIVQGIMMPDLGISPGDEQKGKEVRKEMSSKEKAILCAREAFRFKALDLVLLDVSRFSSFADYFIICSGKSGRQVQGIADNLENDLKSQGTQTNRDRGKTRGPLGPDGLRRCNHSCLLRTCPLFLRLGKSVVRGFRESSGSKGLTEPSPDKD